MVIIVLVVVTVEAFRSFDILFSMTRGGPGISSQILPMLIFRYTFEVSKYGLAAAASYLLVAIGMLLTTVYFFVLMRRKRQVQITATIAKDTAAVVAPAVAAAS